MKYKLTDKFIEINNIKLYQIEALTDIPSINVKKGDLGGYIQSTDNLSQYGNAWVYDDAQVYDNAQVYGNAQVYSNAWVYGDAQVYGNALVHDNARVFGDARVYDNALVRDNARVYGNAQVYGNALVRDNARVYGNAKIKNKSSILFFSIPSIFSITITPQNIAIGCHLKTRKEWLKVSVDEAEKMGLKKEYYPIYRKMILQGMKIVKKEN